MRTSYRVLFAASAFFANAAACGGSTEGAPALAPDPGGDAGGANVVDASAPDAATGDAAAHPDAKPDAAPLGPFTRPPFPQLVSSGGPTLANPKVVPIFFPGYAWKTQVTDWLSKLGATPYWSAATSEYGVGALVMGTPVLLTEQAPTATDSQTIQGWLGEKLNGTHPEFGTPDSETIYMIFYPASTQIDGAGGSCTSYGGYHEDIAVNGKPIPYAVLPECPTFGPVNGLDMVTGAGSHELIEAATDPYPSSNAAYSGLDDPSAALEIFLGGNAENGDMCSTDWSAFFKPTGGDYVVQRGWSNASAKAGKDPCQPLNPANEPYFAATPRLPDSATVLGVKASAVKIAVGDSATIEVALWSLAPTSMPWTVEAKQPSRVKPPQLEFTWDKTTGKDGDTLHLTIKALAKGTRGYQSFAIKSSIGNQKTYWAGLVVQ